MDFISRDALIAAMNAWVLDKAKPLGQILVEQQALWPRRSAPCWSRWSQEHLEQHGNDAEKSLAAVSSVGSVREDLQQIADPDVQASLAHVAAARAGRRPRRHARLPVGRRLDLRGPALPHPAAARQGRPGRGVRGPRRGAAPRGGAQGDPGPARRRPDSRARFLLEAEITGGLEHPGIVPVYGLGHYADGRPFYAMRFIKGDSLKDAIERFHQADSAGRDPGERSLALRKLLGRFVDVCNAIAYAHSRGVLHRDLKPGNIMLGQYGETLVVDWGLAKVVGRPEATSCSRTKRRCGPTSAERHRRRRRRARPSARRVHEPRAGGGPARPARPGQRRLQPGRHALLPADRPAAVRRTPTWACCCAQVQQGEFPPPRQVKRDVPRPLEAICLQGDGAAARGPLRLAARAGRRHRALAGRRAGHGLPRAAVGPPGRWARRHRALVGVAASLLVTAVVLLTVGMLAVQPSNGERTRRTPTWWWRGGGGQASPTTRDALDAMSSQIVDDWLARQQART